MSLLKSVQQRHQSTKETVLTMEEYLDLLKSDSSIAAGPAERLLKAIGEPTLTDTSTDRRLLRLFGNTTIRTYAPFKYIFGLERTIEKIVSFLKHSSQGLEESRQVLYLRGPVGSAKSTIVEILKDLMEQEPIFVLAVQQEDGTLLKSPIQESPLGLFHKEDAEVLGVSENRLPGLLSPWARKRLDAARGDISVFKVVRLFPSRAHEVAITKVEAGDENHNDISTLVGKTSIRQLSRLDQTDPDAYSYSGGLCKANQGCLDFVEMNKAPLTMLNPLLTATQEHNYNPTESIGSIPFDGLIFAHSNDTEWQKFKNDKRNEAFIDRFSVVDVVYNLRVDEEVKIIRRYLDRSILKDAPVAPHTLDILSKLVVLSRISEDSEKGAVTKMRVYNGEAMKEKDPNSKTLEEYLALADDKEGFVGISTRDSFKIVSDTFDQDAQEVAADPIGLFKSIGKYAASKGDMIDAIEGAKEFLMKEYHKAVTDDISSAYLDCGDDFCQAEFERYITYAQCYIEKQDFRDPETNELITFEQLEKELKKIEEPAQIGNPEGFRYDIVHFADKVRLDKGQFPRWNEYQKLAKILKDRMSDSLRDMLPVISFSKKSTKEQDHTHTEFVKRMMDMGYTMRQVRRVVDWQIKFKNS